MDANLKSYLKSAFIQFGISLIFPILVYFLIRDKIVIWYWVLLNLISLLPGYFKYKSRILYEQRLKKRGLTFEDIDNIGFVKSWHEIRQKGVVKYTIIDGGAYFGFFLSLFIGLISFFFHKTFHYIMAEPANMINFIGLTYLAGATSGVIIYRILWIYNENRFIRLTDPLR